MKHSPEDIAWQILTATMKEAYKMRVSLTPDQQMTIIRVAVAAVNLDRGYRGAETYEDGY